jgi:hypothetical protein
MTTIEELKGYLAIDKHALDDELVQQPQLFFTIAEACERAAQRRDDLKEELSTIDATLDAKFRKEEKVTDAAVKNKIVAHKEHIEASEAYLEAKHEANMLTVLKESMQTRGYMLRDLVQLYHSSYFERNSVKDTGQTDAYVYQQRRQRIALRRGEGD